MRIALVTGDSGGQFPDPDDYFSLCALEHLFEDYSPTAFSLKGPTSEETISALNRHDVVILIGAHLLGDGRDSPPALRLRDYEAIRRPIIPLGIRVPNFDSGSVSGEEEITDLLNHWYRSTGPLSVGDFYSYQYVSRALGPRGAILTGPAALLNEESRLRQTVHRSLFCPPDPKNLSAHGRQKVRAVYRTLCKIEPTLFLAQSPADFALGARPGLSTLGSFRFPSLQKKALVSSRSLLSARLTPLLIALAHDVPSVLLCTNDADVAEAEAFGLPHIDGFSQSTCEEVRERFHHILAHYPTDKTRTGIASLKNGLTRHLARSGLLPGGILPTRTKWAVPSAAPLTVCCICDETYFPFTAGLIENLREVHGGLLEIHVLALDSKARELCESRFPDSLVTVHRLADLWNPDELVRILDRPMALQAYSSKSRLLLKVLTTKQRPVFYFDSDLYFFSSPDCLIKEFNGRSLLLFPQWNRSLGKFRLHGLFNAGMIGVAPGAEAFLDLWKNLCLFECTHDEANGYYVDQGFLDFMPIFFENTAIFKGLDQNVAPWNIETLGVRLPKASPLKPHIENGMPLGSYHAAFPDPLGLFELKFCWDQLVAFFSGPLEANSLSAMENTLHQQRLHWLNLNRFVFVYGQRTPLKFFFRPRLSAAVEAMDFLISGRGQWVLTLLAALHRLFVRGTAKMRWIGKQTSTKEEREFLFWSRLQKNLLFGESPPKKKAAATREVPHEESPQLWH